MLSNDMNVTISTALAAAVTVYADPLTCLMPAPNDTEPVVACWVIFKFTVWPGTCPLAVM